MYLQFSPVPSRSTWVTHRFCTGCDWHRDARPRQECRVRVQGWDLQDMELRRGQVKSIFKKTYPVLCLVGYSQIETHSLSLDRSWRFFFIATSILVCIHVHIWSIYFVRPVWERARWAPIAPRSNCFFFEFSFMNDYKATCSKANGDDILIKTK